MVRRASLSKRLVLVVVRWDGVPPNKAPKIWTDDLVTVVSVHEDVGSAEREVERLNALGGAHYFFQWARFFEEPLPIVDS